MLVSPALSASTLLTPRRYLRIALLTGLTINILNVPYLWKQPGATFGYCAVRFGHVMVLALALLGLNYYLLYSKTLTQRWLRRQALARRRIIQLGGCLFAGALISGLLRVGTEAIGYGNAESWGVTLLSGVMFGSVILIVQSFMNLTERAHHLTQENEQFKRVQLQASYESLKQQLSPHFLFNSLSTLRGLIHEDTAAAERFVDEMSQVYRYLLPHSERNAVALRDELGFLASYAFLLKMRFGESLVLHVDLPDYVLDRLVPPLALQTLVENVVKHNIMARKQPLHLYVELSQADYLLVRHLHRPRLTPEPGSGIGLRNLASRVRLLHQAELIVEKDTEFRVSLPLPA